METLREQASIEEMGVRMFIKELQKHDFYQRYMVERLLNGDENPRKVIQSLVDSLSNCGCEDSTPQIICSKMILNFHHTDISFSWSDSKKGSLYWMNAWRKLLVTLKT